MLNAIQDIFSNSAIWYDELYAGLMLLVDRHFLITYGCSSVAFTDFRGIVHRELLRIKTRDERFHHLHYHEQQHESQIKFLKEQN